MTTCRLLLSMVGLGATLASASLAGQDPPRLAPLGQCSLLNGAVIPDCQVGYRVFGASHAENGTVLIPTWLGGRSEDWIPLLGSEGLVDSTRYQVVVVDALANSVSSSPSNRSAGPSPAFPEIAIEDMVESQHRLVRDVLGLDRLHAVVGVSMGGIQAFEWAASHPDFVDRFVSIVGTPRGTRHERLWLRTVERVIETGHRHDVPEDTVHAIVSGIIGLLDIIETVNGPDASATDSLVQASARNRARTGIPLEDFAAQVRAIIDYDFYRSAGASASRLQELGDRFLIVGSPEDRVVYYAPAMELARRAGADTLVVSSSCGHMIFTCEAAAIGERIASFLRN